MNRPITMSTLIRMLLVSNGLTLLAVVAIIVSTPTFARTLAQITTAATPPATVPYQGTLTDASGTPINDSVAMTFKFYAAPTGGTALWTEQRTGSNAVPVTNGLFSVALGQVTPIPANVLAQPLWLGISVNGDAEMTPREAILGVPFASIAGNVVAGAISQTQAPGLVASSTNTKVAYGTATVQRADGLHYGPIRPVSLAEYGFTEPPTVICGMAGGAGFTWNCHTEYETKDSFGIWVRHIDNSTDWTTAEVRWIAIGK